MKFRALVFWTMVVGCGPFASFGEDGAGYVEPELSERDLRFWAFQAPVRSEVPNIADAEMANPLDAFLLASLREKGVEDFSPSADPVTLLRRLSFDLTGLPPDAGVREWFLTTFEKAPESAWKDAIDALLDSPHYGERWAQHWLDVARFADTDGFEHDKTRADAWRFRDWVIRAFNDDLPYDRFVALQIAGDRLDPNEAVATGFLMAAPDMPDLNIEAERRHNVLNELTSTVGAAFLGLTMECAQCHDHKSDPISQADFYRMRAVFEEFALPRKDQSLPSVFPVNVKAKGPGHLFVRGDFRRVGPEMTPGFPRVISGDSESSGVDRVALADWLTRPENPLTARVIVNRVWQHHFGEPLVGTPSDFGKLGDRPSHPELLDWLATELIRQNWSLKALHRLILQSRAWRQSSQLKNPQDAALAEDWANRLLIDPDNRLLSRQSRKRLDGESVRDTMLFVSARLNEKMGGPGIRPPLPAEVTETLLKNQWPVTEDLREHDRRSIYLFARRNLRFPLFDVLDRPDANQSCSRRLISTTAPQALTLMNDTFVQEMADGTADRLRKLMPNDSAGQVTSAYVAIIGREPTIQELSRIEAFLADDNSLDQVCLALFNANEFIYVD